MSADEAKIGYRTLGGWMSTAYVTCDDEAMTAKGTSKHSDEPVVVRWSDTLREWVETPTKPAHPPLSPTAAESDTGTHTERESAADEGISHE